MANKGRVGHHTKMKPLRTKAEKRADRSSPKGGKRARRATAAQHMHHG